MFNATQRNATQRNATQINYAYPFNLANLFWEVSNGTN